MSIKVTEELLQFSYEEDNSSYDIEEFFTKNGNQKLNFKSKKQIMIILQELANKLNIDDEYSIKRLETTLHYELPFFAVNRRLIRNWLLENFIY